MSLATTASPWTNENVQPTKRKSTIGRPSPPTIEETESTNEKNSGRVNALIEKLSTDNVGNGLANFEPIHKPIINVKRNTEDGEENESDSESERDHETKNTQKHAMFSANDSNLAALSNYNQTYMAPRLFQSNSQHAMMGGGDDRLMEKINYMIHMLEEQQMEKTSNITEEFILYTFLGIFVIFTVDSFTRAGKYIR
jgi:hypothetical protein